MSTTAIRSISPTIGGINKYDQNILQSGSLTINGKKITIRSSDSLRIIANKINNKNILGVTAELISVGNNKFRLVITTNKAAINIIDNAGVLTKLLNAKQLGTSENCLIQLVSTEGKTVKINYNKTETAPASNPSALSTLHENTKQDIAVMKATGPLQVLRNPLLMEENDDEPVKEKDDEIGDEHIEEYPQIEVDKDEQIDLDPPPVVIIDQPVIEPKINYLPQEKVDVHPLNINLENEEVIAPYDWNQSKLIKEASMLKAKEFEENFQANNLSIDIIEWAVNAIKQEENLSNTDINNVDYAYLCDTLRQALLDTFDLDELTTHSKAIVNNLKRDFDNYRKYSPIAKKLEITNERVGDIANRIRHKWR